MEVGETDALLLLTLGGLFLLGLAADLIGRHSFLPRVSLLLLSGVAVGEAGFDLLPEGFFETWFPALTNVALAFVGFMLGQQVSAGSLRQRGKQLLAISLCKVLGAWAFVTAAMLLIGMNPVVALLLGGIAPATAPAVTYDIIEEMGARGEFPDTVLAIVAVDDIWGLLTFVLMSAVAAVLVGVDSVSANVGAAMFELAGSIGLGIVLGVPMAYLTGRVQPGQPMLAEAIGFVLLGAGLAGWLGFIPILTAMAMGASVATFARHHDRPFNAISGVEWPVMILFFVLAGASARIEELTAIGTATATYVLARCLGIYAGTNWGCRLAGTEERMRRWLGLALFPQAGVALGMALLASQRFADWGTTVLAVVISSTIILEVLSPALTRHALRSASARR